jgi:hypothetical protein
VRHDLALIRWKFVLLIERTREQLTRTVHRAL